MPAELLARASRWADLKRWERRELGQDLRRLGLSYREIAAVVPVGKGTLSTWCRDIELPADQRARLQALRPRLETRLRAARRRRDQTIARAGSIRDHARVEARSLAADPVWVAGVVAYWAEGAKGPMADLRFTNSDPAMVGLFVAWVRRYLEASHGFTVQLHLHSGQDEGRCRSFWSGVTGVPEGVFGKSFVKPEGTGHRKNLLYNGTALVRVRRSSAMFHRVMGWIEGLRETWAASSTG